MGYTFRLAISQILTCGSFYAVIMKLLIYTFLTQSRHITKLTANFTNLFL